MAEMWPGLVIKLTGLDWTRQQWPEVLFTDKSKFNLYYVLGNKHIYRRLGERFAQCCVHVLERNLWGGGGIMVWALISSYEYI